MVAPGSLAHAMHSALAAARPPAPAPPPPTGPAHVSLPAVLVAAALLAVDAAISLSLGLGVHWWLLVGLFRCIGQLTLLGYMLVPIFSYKLPALVAAYACFMLAVGSGEAAGRPAYRYPGMYAHVVLCLGVTAFGFLAYSLAFAVRPAPWWNAQYSIPTLGLMLGNAVSGVAVGLGALLEELATGGDRVEAMLCLGATRWEACSGAVARAARLAATPILNQLSVVGLVWIPGMMTGQMIAGADPAQARAARYQMVVMFVVSATTVSAATATVCLAARTLVDGKARLRRDRLSRAADGGGWGVRLKDRVGRWWAARRRGAGGGERVPLLDGGEG